jgi:small-conductance mechanosensitive channel
MDRLLDFFDRLDWNDTERFFLRNGWLLLGTAVVVGLLVCLVTSGIVNLILRRRPLEALGLLRQHARRAFYFFVPALFFLMATNVQSARFLRRHPNVDKASEILFLVATTWLVLRLLKVGELYLIRHRDLNDDVNISQRKFVTQVKFVQRLFSTVTVVIGVSLVLMAFQGSRKVGLSLLTSAGIVSVLVGFAAQKTLSNFLAGVQIAFTQQIRLGDAVVVEKEWGRIEEINLTHVVVRLWDRRRLILPITYFVETPYQNWTRSETSIIGTVILHLDYDVPVERLRKKAEEIVAADPLWTGETFVVQVTDTLPDCIVVRVLVSASDASTAFDLRCHVREALIQFLRDEYPQSLPQTRVQLTGTKAAHQPARAAGTTEA